MNNPRVAFLHRRVLWRPARLARPVAAVGLALALVTAGLAIVARAEIIEQILIKVNGEIFTKTDLEQRQVAALRQRGQSIDLKSQRSDEALRKMLNEITPQIVLDAVDEALMVQRGKELGYKLGEEQFKTVVDNLKKENKIETDDQFQAALKQEGITMADLRRNVERSMIVSRVQQNEVFSKIAISDEEARRYDDAHQNEFTTLASVTLREVLVAVATDPKGLSVAQDETAQAKAEQLRARAAAGEDLDKIAAEAADSPTRTAALIGPISLGDVSGDLRKMLEALKAGQLTPVVRTNRGYEFFKLESMSPAQILPFDKAREQISERVFTGKRQGAYDQYLEKMRSQAIIEFKSDDIKKAYDQAVATHATAVAAAPASP